MHGNMNIKFKLGTFEYKVAYSSIHWTPACLVERLTVWWWMMIIRWTKIYSCLVCIPWN